MNDTDDDFMEEEDAPCNVPLQPTRCLDLALMFWAHAPGSEQPPQQPQVNNIEHDPIRAALR